MDFTIFCIYLSSNFLVQKQEETVNSSEQLAYNYNSPNKIKKYRCRRQNIKPLSLDNLSLHYETNNQKPSTGKLKLLKSRRNISSSMSADRKPSSINPKIAEMFLKSFKSNKISINMNRNNNSCKPKLTAGVLGSITSSPFKKSIFKTVCISLQF